MSSACVVQSALLDLENQNGIDLERVRVMVGIKDQHIRIAALNCALLLTVKAHLELSRATDNLVTKDLVRSVKFSYEE